MAFAAIDPPSRRQSLVRILLARPHPGTTHATAPAHTTAVSPFALEGLRVTALKV